jgi:hypothetical protein
MRLDRDMIEVDRSVVPVGSCDSGGVEILRWQVGDATILRIWEVDAAAALDGLIPKLDPAAVSRAAWLTPNFG